MVPKLLRSINFSGSYGFAPTWPRAYLGVSLPGDRLALASEQKVSMLISRELKKNKY